MNSHHETYEYTRHFSDANLVAGGRTDSRIQRSQDAFGFLGASNLQYASNAPRDPLDSRIVRFLNVRTSPGRRSPKLPILGFWERWVSRSSNSDDRNRDPWVPTHSGIIDGSFDPWILRSLYTSSRIYGRIYAIYMKMRSRNLVPLIRSSKIKEEKKMRYKSKK